MYMSVCTCVTPKGINNREKEMQTNIIENRMSEFVQNSELYRAVGLVQTFP